MTAVNGSPIEPHLAGDLAEFTAFEVLEYLSFTRKSGRIDFSSYGGRTAEVVLASGSLVKATCGHLDDDEAVLTLLWWKVGRFAYRHEEVEATAGGRLEVHGLMMEAVRLADEVERHSADLPPSDASLRLTGVDTACPGCQSCEVVEICAVLDGSPGLTLGQVETAVSFCPVKVRYALELLRASGRLTWTSASDAQPDVEPGPCLGKTIEPCKAGVRGLIAHGSTLDHRALERVLASLAERLGPPSTNLASTPNGPSFARFRRAQPGIVSLTFLPIDRTNRYLFDNFASSVDFVSLIDDGTPEGRHWRDSLPRDRDVETWRPFEPLDSALLDKLERSIDLDVQPQRAAGSIPVAS